LGILTSRDGDVLLIGTTIGRKRTFHTYFVGGLYALLLVVGGLAVANGFEFYEVAVGLVAAAIFFLLMLYVGDTTEFDLCGRRFSQRGSSRSFAEIKEFGVQRYEYIESEGAYYRSVIRLKSGVLVQLSGGSVDHEDKAAVEREVRDIHAAIVAALRAGPDPEAADLLPGVVVDSPPT